MSGFIYSGTDKWHIVGARPGRLSNIRVHRQSEILPRNACSVIIIARTDIKYKQWINNDFFTTANKFNNSRRYT